MSTCNWLDLETLGSQSIMSKNLPTRYLPMLLLDVSTIISCDGQHQILFSTWWVERILIYHNTNLKNESYSFTNHCGEVWFFFCNNLSKLSWSIFFRCALHHDTRLKASKLSNFNEARKWPLDSVTGGGGSLKLNTMCETSLLPLYYMA